MARLGVLVSKDYSMREVSPVFVKSRNSYRVPGIRAHFKLFTRVSWNLNATLEFYEHDSKNTAAIQLHDQLFLAPLLVLKRDGQLTKEEIQKGLCQRVFKYGKYHAPAENETA